MRKEKFQVVMNGKCVIDGLVQMRVLLSRSVPKVVIRRCDLRRASTLVLSAILVCCIHIKADVWPLVLTGDPIPGTANFRFQSFGLNQGAVINASGTVAFHASFVDPATNLTGEGIFEIVGGQLIPVMLEGQSVPDAPSLFFGSSGDPQINDSGDIVFKAYLSVPNRSFQAIFEKSGDTLKRIVDLDTPVPGAPGQSFGGFSLLQINNRGDIAFGAGLQGNPVLNGIFLASQGSLQPVGLTVVGQQGGVDPNSFSLDNRGDIAFGSFGGISIWSGGSVTTVPLPATVPGTSYLTTSVASPSINDDGNTAAVSVYSFNTGRGALPIRDAVIQWHNGIPEKVAAAGDPVPDVTGVTFAQNFLTTQINESATIFSAFAGVNGHGDFVVIDRYQNGHLRTVTTANQYVDGIGTLDFLSYPSFDTRQGPLITFVAGAAARSMIGIYAATTAPQYTLRFPQIADGGGGAAGGWRTTFILANRSTFPSAATISFFDDTGAPLNLAVAGTQQTQTTVNVPALGVAQVQTQGGGPLKVGWALVQADQNLTGIGTYGLLDSSGTTLSEVGVPAALPLLSMAVFAEAGATTSTGIALANPNSTAATVTLILRDANSSELSRISVVIPAMGHLARYANELFTGIPPGEFEGKIDVISTQPLAGLTLRQRGSVFTSLPVIP